VGQRRLVAEDGGGPGQGTTSEYEITEGRRVSPPEHPTKGKNERKTGEMH